MLISKDTVDDITATVVSANMLSQDVINIINSVLEKLVKESKHEKIIPFKNNPIKRTAYLTTEGNRRILVERADLQAARINYLKKINEIR